MAQNLLRLRRTLSTSLRSLSSTSVARSSPSVSSAVAQSSSRRTLQFQFQSRSFRSSSFSSARPSYGNNQNDEIGPDTILFEGCDYNHWLIVMDFPKDDNKPSPEEMVRTYEETAARGLNISVEEAKKKIYACSTTTYTGFQVLMTEEESKKFEGVPGVVFVLPDSYIDPENKEYGGDKYDNGHITHRPPPFQYERQGTRYRDQNRSPYRQGSMPNQQGNSSYGQQGSPPGGGNYRTSQSYPPQTSVPPRQGENRGHTPANSPGGRDTYQPARDPIPSYQGGNYNQRVQRDGPPGGQSTYARSYGYGQAPSSGTPGHGLNGLQGPGTGGSYGQGPNAGSYGQGPGAGSYGQGSGGYGQGPSAGGYGQGQGPSAGGYGQGQGPSAGGYGQEPSSGGYGQEPSSGGYGQGPSAGGYGPGPSSGGYGPGPRAGASGQGPIAGAQVPGPSSGYPGHGDQSFTQGEQRRMQGEQTNSAYMGHTGTDQGRY